MHTVGSDFFGQYVRSIDLLFITSDTVLVSKLWVTCDAPHVTHNRCGQCNICREKESYVAISC